MEIGSLLSGSSGVGSPLGSDELDRDAFLQLFVTQVQNQNPLEPATNEDFLAQLAQFSSLELLENINGGFDTLARFEQVTQGAALLGKDVQYIDPRSGESFRATVESVRLDANGVNLTVDGKAIPLGFVQEIYEPTSDTPAEDEEASSEDE